MTQSIPPLPQGSASEQADYWLAMLDSPLFDDRQSRYFRQWLAASPDNRQAWEDAKTWWQAMDSLGPAQRAILEAQLPPAAKTGKRRIALTWYAMSAFACLLLAISLTNWHAYFADYHTATGEQRWLHLSDGSEVLLNTDSALSVDFSDRQRNITLHGGEAYFKVAADTGRPFEVHSQGGSVRALGTAFEVKQLESSMAVTVYEHSVRVAFAQGETVERLNEGQRVAAGDGPAGPIENVNLKQSGAWREKRLIFKNQPLRQVIAELNRYRPGSIVVADRELAEHSVTGVFDADHPEAALNAIEKTLALAETRLTDRWVFLRRL